MRRFLVALLLAAMTAPFAAMAEDRDDQPGTAAMPAHADLAPAAPVVVKKWERRLLEIEMQFASTLPKVAATDAIQTGSITR